MKLQIRKFIAASMVAIAALSVSCALDDADFNYPDTTVTPDGGTTDLGDGIGYLSLSDIALMVDVESEDFNTTKAVDESIDTDSYYISIKNSDPESEQADILMTYAELKDLTEDIELLAGNYTISARSYETSIAALGWDNPEYASKDYNFTITEGEVSEVDNDVTCTPANIMASVNMTDELLSKFKTSDLEDTDTELIATITLGDVVATYSLNDEGKLVGEGGDVAYFAEQVDVTTMTLTIKGMYNTAADGDDPTYESITWTSEIDDVAAGQYRNITISLDTENGTASVSVTAVSSSVGIQDVDVDISGSLTEEDLNDDQTSTDSDASAATCSITWRGGYDFDTRYEISTDTTSETFPVIFDMTSETGITTLTIDITSDALTSELLAEMALAQHMDLINPATAEMKCVLSGDPTDPDDTGGLGFPTGDDIEGKTLLVFDISQFMPLLALISADGDVTDFKITLGDASGEVIETLMVKVVE